MEKISVFDIFKVGVGPSSSHTIGPWRAAGRFLKYFQEDFPLEDILSLKVELYGSLAKTGKGHGTDIAVIMGLTGADVKTFDCDQIDPTVKAIRKASKISLLGKHEIPFNVEECVVFNTETKPRFHPNTLVFYVRLKNGRKMSEKWYSIGGGFIKRAKSDEEDSEDFKAEIPFPIQKAKDLLHWHEAEEKSIADICLINELHWKKLEDIRSGLNEIWNVMKESVFRGAHTDGELPGGLKVRRRAAQINRSLLNGKSYKTMDEWIKILQKESRDMDNVTSWISCFALAVNEVNASFGRIVTAPTNGAAGVVPAVLMYLYCFHDDFKEKDIHEFLLVAGEIGSIFKKGATISAAAGGCQAEIGVSSAMAAAALTHCLGGNTKQSVMAAEIAMEHHLGLTCDPVGGLVQIPCIERNSMGAMKAITAAQLALHSDPATARVSLDDVVATMWNTAKDMKSQYKETSEGGLAIQVGLAEC
ncbi:MAG: L-serine ammonia-lyase [Lentisphaeraceae bacterium]|nr:L-serine ammonia-lyase [Lentisphaeraceae bacterium]